VGDRKKNVKKIDLLASQNNFFLFLNCSILKTVRLKFLDVVSVNLGSVYFTLGVQLWYGQTITGTNKLKANNYHNFCSCLFNKIEVY
jgi:hypothetical protein